MESVILGMVLGVSVPSRNAKTVEGRATARVGPRRRVPGCLAPGRLPVVPTR